MPWFWGFPKAWVCFQTARNLYRVLSGMCLLLGWTLWGGKHRAFPGGLPPQDGSITYLCGEMPPRDSRSLQRACLWPVSFLISTSFSFASPFVANYCSVSKLLRNGPGQHWMRHTWVFPNPGVSFPLEASDGPDLRLFGTANSRPVKSAHSVSSSTSNRPFHLGFSIFVKAYLLQPSGLLPEMLLLRIRVHLTTSFSAWANLWPGFH